MPNSLQEFTQMTGITPEMMLLAGIGLGVLFFVLGLSTAMAGPTAEQRRLSAIGRMGSNRGNASDVLRLDDNDPTGILRAFVPKSQKERSQIARKLRQAGIHGRFAVQRFYLIRTVLAVSLPLMFVGLLFLPDTVPLPEPVRETVNGLTWQKSAAALAVLTAIGFYGPALWLKSKVSDRRREIEYGLPNALDLLTVAIEAGLGFDAAMTRVAHEMRPVSPPIAEEFTILQLELQAGKDRQRAFLDMAKRTNVDEMSAFANVIVQSMQFGTSMGDALTNYATEMRITRELRAQEKANKLPVKMSGVLAGIMMPVLLMITLTPIMIRWIRMFAEQ